MGPAAPGCRTSARRAEAGPVRARRYRQWSRPAWRSGHRVLTALGSPGTRPRLPLPDGVVDRLLLLGLGWRGLHAQYGRRRGRVVAPDHLVLDQPGQVLVGLVVDGLAPVAGHRPVGVAGAGCRAVGPRRAVFLADHAARRPSAPRALYAGTGAVRVVVDADHAKIGSAPWRGRRQTRRRTGV